jgi:hypothetical protein
MAANLMHPNIVPVYDFGEWQGYLYIVMALVPGGTLKDRMQGPMPVEAAVRLVGQVADGLGYAHGQGIFHRDVKPTNVLLAAGDWAMLSDFGIARALGETTRLTSPYGTIGTPAYMAPEQWLGGEIDGRADLYSLGIVLYELLTGSPPFTASTSQGLMRQHLEMPVPSLLARPPELPDGLEAALQTVLAKDQHQRYRHAGELKAALDAAVRQLQVADPQSRTDVASPLGPAVTSPYLGQTIRVPRQPAVPVMSARRGARGGSLSALLVLVVILVVLLAGAVGYIGTGGWIDWRGGPSPMATAESVAGPPVDAPTSAPLVPTPTSRTAPAAAPKPVVGAPTAAPPTATALRPPTPTPTLPALSIQPTAPPKIIPTAVPATDQRLPLVERHVSDYFTALNAGDYARAQAVCCTPGWRSRNPLDDWRKNFAGVTDLRFATPYRYPTVSADRIIAEVDYSFANSSGGRRYFTLRWTFVPAGNDWLADDAVASPQQ